MTAVEKTFLIKHLLQSELKEKSGRLEMDQAEADIHVQVVSERYAKREADLRQTLQVYRKLLEFFFQTTNSNMFLGSVVTTRSSRPRPKGDSR